MSEEADEDEGLHGVADGIAADSGVGLQRMGDVLLE